MKLDTVFIGHDINGLADFSVGIVWPSGKVVTSNRIHRPYVIQIGHEHPRFVVGQEAIKHPAGRGWIQPTWEKEAGRLQVADLLANLRNSNDPHAEVALVEHLRLLAIPGERIGFPISDDLSTNEQTALLDATRRAMRFHPKHGWRSWTALPIWRSIAAIFGWARNRECSVLTEMRGKDILVLSILANRLVAAALKIDSTKDDSGALLVTPERAEPGRVIEVGHETFPPVSFEAEILGLAETPQVQRQLAAIGAGAEYARGMIPNDLLQDSAGRWTTAPNLRPHAETRQRSREAFARLLEVAVDRTYELVLIETPDPARALCDRTWAEIASEILGSNRRAKSIELAPSGAVACGSAEYAARLAFGLPTFFDYLPQIDILAQSAMGPRFVSLFPGKKRVPGNQSFEARLEGIFEVPVGAERLNFQLFLEEGKKEDVRRAETVVPNPPARPVLITLRVEQRPASGHALIEILPSPADALGPQRVSLDWRAMAPTGFTRAEVLEIIDQERELAFPDCAPSASHWAVWEVNEVERTMKGFLAAEPATRDYITRLDSLTNALRTRVNPYLVGKDMKVRVALSAFASDGSYPPAPGRDDLVRQVRDRISQDIAESSRSGRSLDNVRKLCLAGTWMFAAVPEGVSAYIVSQIRRKELPGNLTQGVGRALSEEGQVRAAFAFLHAKLLLRRKSEPIFNSATNELKAGAQILQFRGLAGTWLESKQAELFTEAALQTVRREVEEGAALQQRFLWAATVFLLALRHREANRSFLAPPMPGMPKGQLYTLAELVLTEAEKALAKRRRYHPLAPDIVRNARAFLTKTGGNRDIIKIVVEELDQA